MGNSVSFSQSLLCFWIRGSVRVTDTNVEFSIRDRRFPIIPGAKLKHSYPLHRIKKISVDTERRIDCIVIGAFLMLLSVGICLFFRLLFSWAEMFDAFRTPLVCALVAFVSGFLLFLSGFRVTFALHTVHSQNAYVITLPFYEERKLLDLGAEIHGACRRAS